MVRRLLTVFLEPPSLSALALYCSMCCPVISLIGLCPKNGTSEDWRMYFFCHCSESLLFGTTYSLNHLHANRENSSSADCSHWSIRIRRANFCRKTASYASAPAREFSGLRLR